MKNIIIILSISFAFSQSALSQPDQPKLVITHLTGDFYVYTTYSTYQNSPVPSNSMYLVTTNGVVMFDVAWDSTQRQPLLDSIEKKHRQKVVLSISTHFHEDRTGGLDFLKQKGVKTFSSKMTYDLCKERNEEQSQFYFTHDTVFTIGNYQFQAYYPGPGHTKDNIVVLFNKEKILYGACFIKSTESTNMGNIADADLAAWPASIKKLTRKFPKRDYVIPGHGGWENKKSLEHTLKLLQESSH